MGLTKMALILRYNLVLLCFLATFQLAVAAPISSPSDSVVDVGSEMLTIDEAEQALLAPIEALMADGRTQDALDMLNAIAKDGNGGARTYFLKATLHMDLGETDLATESVQQGLMRKVDEPNLLALSGMLAFQSGDPMAAERAFARAIQLAPENRLALRLSANLQTEIGNFERALSFLQTLLDTWTPEPGPVDVRLGKAGLHRELQQYAAIVDTLAPIEPDTLIGDGAIQSAILLGEAYAALKIMSAAQDQYERLTDLLGPDDPRTELLASRLAVGRGRLDEAAGILEPLSEQSGLYQTEARLRLARLYTQLGELDRAALALREVWADAEGSDVVAALNDLVGLYESVGKTDDAIATIRETIERYPDQPAFYLMLADYTFKSELPDQSLAAIADGLAAAPNYPDLLYLEGIVHATRGHTPMAQMSYQKAVDADPSHIRAWISLAKTEHQLAGHGVDTHAGTLRVLDEGLAANPGDEALLIEKARISEEEGRLEDAERFYTQALARSPNNMFALTELAYVMAEKQSTVSDALSLTEQLLKRSPNSGSVAYSAGRVHNRAGNHEQAIRFLEAVTRSDPANGHAHFYLADSLYSQGRSEEARQLAIHALEAGLTPAQGKAAIQLLGKISGFESLTSKISQISMDGVETAIGQIQFSDTPQGLEIVADVSGLSPGSHGFHIHENPTCEPAAEDGVLVSGLGAGDHLKTSIADIADKHNHTPMGDLPLLMVDDAGEVENPIYAPSLRVEMIRNRSILVHDGVDGPRIACGLL